MTPSAAAVAPPPPFDPDVAAFLAALGDHFPREFTFDLIPALWSVTVVTTVGCPDITDPASA